jgi:dTDP-4-amino-4,6-dideoxygalactose transaminase
MKKLQMVDLVGQLEPIQDEIQAGFDEVMSNASFINGPHVHNFQADLEKYLDVKNVIPCGNGTDALQIAMMGLGLKPGDEVITADFTFAATVEVIALLNLTPVLVDVEEDTFNIDPKAIEKSITSKTKAIVPVHLFGHAANMEAIMEIANKHKLYVIEDNAQGIGASYHYKDGGAQKTGVVGHVAATSFFPSKNLGCYGDGGAIFTNDDELAHTIRGVVNHGMYERYHHDVVGVNSRLDSLQAVVLKAKLPKLDDYNTKRQMAARAYTKALQNHEDIVTPIAKTNRPCKNKDLGICDTCSCHVFHQYTLKIKNGKRDGLAEYLKSQNIPHGIYYPIPLHLQKAYKDERYNDKDFQVTNQLAKEVLSLPMHTELDEEQIDFITKHILKYLNEGTSASL